MTAKHEDLEVKIPKKGKKVSKGLSNNDIFKKLTVFDDSLKAGLDQARLNVANKDGATTAQMGFFGNVWVRLQFYPKKGDSFLGHKHDHDHMSLVSTGAVKVEVDGQAPKIYKAPAFFEVPANINHFMTAEEDGTSVYCVFAVLDKDGKPAITTVEVDKVKKSNVRPGAIKK